jgi:hypothetical protein
MEWRVTRVGLASGAGVVVLPWMLGARVLRASRNPCLPYGRGGEWLWRC